VRGRADSVVDRSAAHTTATCQSSELVQNERKLGMTNQGLIRAKDEVTIGSEILPPDLLGGGDVNWDAIGAIAEAIGAAGVIASLLYLASQVRGSTRASAVDAKLQSTRLLTDLLDSWIQAPELTDLHLRGLADLDSLSKEEYYRFSNLCLKAFWFFSAAHFQFRTRTLSESEWYENKIALHFWLRGPGLQAWWAKFGRASFGPEFRGFIDDEITALTAQTLDTNEGSS
jgi:hypothetical protein